jgi:hypothetical protein
MNGLLEDPTNAFGEREREKEREWCGKEKTGEDSRR